MCSEKKVRHIFPYALIASILILAMMDTGVFYFPSLSTSLLPDFLICCLSVIMLGFIVKVKNNGLFFLFVWIVFVGVYSLFVPCERYRLIYIVSTLLFAIDLICLVEKERLKLEYVENVFLLGAFLQILTILLQIFRIVPSCSKYFLVTGLNENPSATAIFLVLCLPFIVKHLNIFRGNLKVFFLFFFFLMIASIFVLNCRTAYVGLVVVLCVSCFKQFKCLIKKFSLPCRMAAFALAMGMTLLGVYGLYKMKENSSDGRIFIWKNSIQMVYEKPLGYGYGMFEKDYNLKQATYFQYKERSEREILLANQVFMPYNDTLEQCVEGGLLGGTFYLLFYIVMICKSYKRKKNDTLAIALCAFVMSMFNFLYTYPIAWLLLMYSYAEASLGEEREEWKAYLSRKYSCAFVGVLGIFVIILLNTNLNFIKAQYQLKKINQLLDKHIIVDEVFLASLKDEVSTSELYYTSLAKNFLLERKYECAIDALNVAKKYTSSPSVYLSMATNYAKCDNISEAIQCVLIAKGIIPHHFVPDFLLMELYVKCGESKKALMQARHILKKPIKVHSEKVDEIRKEAFKYIQAYEK